MTEPRPRGRPRKFVYVTYHPDDPALLGSEKASREAAAMGSAALLDALIVYARRHHPGSDLARRGRAA